MKGYVMILYVNAAVLGLVAVASLGYGLLLHREYNHCREQGGTEEMCAQSKDAANGTYRVAPFLLIIAAVLFTVGYMTNPTKPAEPDPDPLAPPAEPPPPAP
ncbi:MAG: hypothetical protein HYT80_03795 [Euryarchaeota archaeon]|nr:hypothetical protein [Euryarchaeota archaeon]